MQKKRHSLEFMRENTHLRLRTRLHQTLASIRNTATMAVHDFFQSQTFMHIHTPILTPLDCEGGGEVFAVTPQSDLQGKSESFFNGPAYLSVSSQLHLEMAASSLGRVYTISPCFRADPGSKDSTRHLAEFHMVEAEWAWPSVNSLAGLDSEVSLIDELGGLCRVSQDLIQSCVKKINDRHEGDLQYLHKELAIHYGHPIVSTQLESSDSYTTMSYTDTFNILKRRQDSRKVKFKTQLREWGQPLQSEHEKYLCSKVLDNKAVFVTDYPAECKPFYMKHNEQCVEDRQTAACMDLLVPQIGELIGGSVREDDLQALEAQLFKQFCTESKEEMSIESMNEEQQLKWAAWRKRYEWYLDLRKYGSVPHGGFGMGLERLLMHVTGIENIRDVVLSPRFRSRCQM